MKIFLFLFLYFLNSAVFADALPDKLFNVTIGDSIEDYISEYVRESYVSDYFTKPISYISENKQINTFDTTDEEYDYYSYSDTDRQIKKIEIPIEERKKDDIDKNKYFTEDMGELPYFVFEDKCTKEETKEVISLQSEKASHEIIKYRLTRTAKEKNNIEPKKESKNFISIILEYIRSSTYTNKYTSEFDAGKYLYNPEIRLQLLNNIIRNENFSCYNIYVKTKTTPSEKDSISEDFSKIIVGIDAYEIFYDPDYNNNVCLNEKNNFMEIFSTIYNVDKGKFSNRFFINDMFGSLFKNIYKSYDPDQKETSSLHYNRDNKNLVLSITCLYTKLFSKLSVNLLTEEQYKSSIFNYKTRPSGLNTFNSTSNMKEIDSINFNLLTDLSGLL